MEDKIRTIDEVRQACRDLLEKVPNEGLSELEETLVEIINYYGNK